MNHLSEEDLVLQYYGEPPAEAAGESDVAAHLASCESCAGRLAELREVLNTLDRSGIPDRGDNYGSEVWARVSPRLSARGPQSRVDWRAWGAVAAMFVVSIAGYWIGRTSTGAAHQPKPSDRGVKERILLVALTDHFERSQMVLAEIENAEAGSNGTLDVAFERSQAEDLLDANRLYRLTAVANGNVAAASLLDDLERTLVDIAHAPERMNRDQIEKLRERVEDRGLTFKMKVFSTGLANQAKETLSKKERL